MPDEANVTTQNVEPQATGMIANLSNLIPGASYIITINSRISEVYSEPAMINTSTGKLNKIQQSKTFLNLLFISGVEQTHNLKSKRAL